MKAGLVLPQSPEDGAGGTWREIRDTARRAEDGGVDSVWVSDHFFYRPEEGDRVGTHEAWTLVSALAATTERVQIGTLVLATSFRSPGLLAKMAATADDVAGGRLILGLGCGWHEPEYTAFGYPFDHRVGRFEESLEITTRLLREGSVTFKGRWYQVDDAIVLPPPAHRTPILVAARRTRMLRATARFADAWQTAWFGRPDDKFRAQHADLLEACAAEGRDPATLEATVGINVGSDPDNDPQLPLDAAAIADGLAEWAALGVGHVMIGAYPVDEPTWAVVLDGIRRYRATGR
jgi:alkanesulfonate monooxygenase SsuD/methylene tetrahydromethanopterin reductase-like flavin-dependent oxidoreductase (luciferase family)